MAGPLGAVTVENVAFNKTGHFAIGLPSALVQLEVRRPGPCRLLAQPSAILVPPDGCAALNIRIKLNNISREQPAQQAQVSLKGVRGGWGSPGLHKRVSVVRIFRRSARKSWRKGLEPEGRNG